MALLGGGRHRDSGSRTPGRAPQTRACKGVASARLGRTILDSIVIDPALPVGSTRSGRGPATAWQSWVVALVVAGHCSAVRKVTACAIRRRVN